MGLGGAGVADDVLAVNCQIAGRVAGIGEGVRGTGDLRWSKTDVVVVNQAGTRIGTLDPDDPLTIQVGACLKQRFRYVARVTIGPTGATLIDVATAT